MSVTIQVEEEKPRYVVEQVGFVSNPYFLEILVLWLKFHLWINDRVYYNLACIVESETVTATTRVE